MVSFNRIRGFMRPEKFRGLEKRPGFSHSDGEALTPNMTTASRTSGVAPLGVVFDAVDEASPAWTSGVVQPADGDYASFHYEWDFGDPSSGNWATGRQNLDESYPSKNTAIGYLAAHVYENPGTYTVTLTVTDTAGATQRYTQDVVVSAFSGTTYYVSSSGGSDANAGTSESLPLQSLAAAQTKLATNTRILFKRGDSWSTSADTGLDLEHIPGPGIIGAYGTGSRPILTFTSVAVALYCWDQADWRFVDLDLRGPGLAESRGIFNPGTGSLVLRCYAEDWQWAMLQFTSACGVVFAENEIHYSISEPIYLAATSGVFGQRRNAIIGGNLGDMTSSHAIRVHSSKFVISHTSFHDVTGGHFIKLAGRNADDDPSRYAIVSDNLFGSGGASYLVSIGLQDYLVEQYLSHVVVERNTWTSGDIAVQSRGADYVTVRNNIVRGPGYLIEFGDSHRGFSTWHGWKVYNNVISNPADYGRLISGDIGGIPTGLVVKNNIIYSPADIYYTNLILLLSTSASASEITSDNNCIYAPNRIGGVLFQLGAATYTLAQWRDLGSGKDQNSITSNPLFVNSATDLRLQSSSPCRNTGVDLPWVRSDHEGDERPQGTYTDMGAFEYAG